MKTITDNQQQKKRTSKGKAKIPITRIDNKTARQVCFSKRRLGLFKKCSKLCSSIPGTEFAAITFSVGGKPFSHGYPSFDTVINRFLDDNRQGNSSRNVVGSDKNWWEASVDDMKLEELEEFLVSLKGLQNGVVSRVEEFSNYYEKSIENFKVESYDFPDVIDCVCTDTRLSCEFTDYNRETTESFDLGPVVANTGTLFDVIKGINFGCNDATVCPNSDNCQEFMEIVDFEAVDAIPDALGSEFSSEIQRIDFGSDVATVSPNSDNCKEFMEIIDFESVDAIPDVQGSDFSSEIQRIDFGSDVDATPDAQGSDFSSEIQRIDFGSDVDTVSPNPDNCKEFMEIIDFESVDAIPDVQGSEFSSEIQRIEFGSDVDATPDAQGSDFSTEIQRIDFGSDDETFSLQFNSQEKRNSFDLTEVLKNVDAECNIARLGAQVSDKSSWMDDSYFLSALSCC